MSTHDHKRQHFWQGIVLSLSARGHKILATERNAHHAAMHPVVTQFNILQRSDRAVATFPTGLRQSPLVHTYVGLDDALLELWRKDVVSYARSEPYVQINAKAAAFLLSDGNLYTPYERTVLSELTRHFRPV